MQIQVIYYITIRVFNQDQDPVAKLSSITPENSVVKLIWKHAFKLCVKMPILFYSFFYCKITFLTVWEIF